MRKLRPYQEKAKSEIYKAWNEGNRNVLLLLPTGGGKTVTFCSIANEMAMQPTGPRFPTAIMVHRKELIQQISLTLAEEGLHHNIIAPRSTIIGIQSAQRQLYGTQFYDYNAPITVFSVDTLNKRVDSHRNWAEKIRLWICDEAAHLLRDNKWGKAVACFPNAIGLGVTATPQRLDRRGLGRHADGVFDTMVQGPSVKWLIQQGFLSKYKVVIPPSDYAKYLKKASDGSDYSRQALAEAAQKSHIVGDIVENYIKFAFGKQAIVFAPDIGTAGKIEKNFNDSGIPAKTLTGETPDAERLKGIMDFRNKVTRVLINVDLFDEGLDVPGIEVVIMGRATESLGKFLQMCGRGLRVMPGKDHCLIIDHVGNIMGRDGVGHGLPDAEREWTLDRIVKRRDRVNLLRICQNFMCNAPFDRYLTECPFCGEPVFKQYRREGNNVRVSPQQVDGDLELVDPETLREMIAGVTLEEPAVLEERVTKAAGPIAGAAARKKQIERIECQKELAQMIALWAGYKKQQGRTDRQINKEFFLIFDKTITVALSEPKAMMLETMKELQERIPASFKKRMQQTFNPPKPELIPYAHMTQERARYILANRDRFGSIKYAFQHEFLGKHTDGISEDGVTELEDCYIKMFAGVSNDSMSYLKVLESIAKGEIK